MSPSVPRKTKKSRIRAIERACPKPCSSRVSRNPQRDCFPAWSQRDEDRLKPGDLVELRDLLEGVSADELVQEVTAIVEEGGGTDEVLVRVTDFNAKLEILRNALKTGWFTTVDGDGRNYRANACARNTEPYHFYRPISSGAERSCGFADSQELSNQLSLTAACRRSGEIGGHLCASCESWFQAGAEGIRLWRKVSRVYVTAPPGDIKRESIEVGSAPIHQTRVVVDPGELDKLFLTSLNSVYWIPKGGHPPSWRSPFESALNEQRAQVTVIDSGRASQSRMHREFFCLG